MNFCKVELRDRKIIEEYASQYAENSCQYAFPAMYCLNSKYGDCICQKDGWLFILRERLCTQEYRVYLFPLGEGNVSEAIRLLAEDASEHHQRICFDSVTESVKIRTEAACHGRFRSEENRDLAEYLYRREALISLSGKALQKRRHMGNEFRKRYGNRVSVHPIVPSDISEIRAFQASWMDTKTGTDSWAGLLKENESVDLAFSNYEALGMEGVIIRIDGKICAYCIGFRISGNCFVARNEKADREYFGIYTALHQEIAKYAAGTEYINLEEDIGIPGLRIMKLSYHPSILMKKYIMKEVPQF